MKFIRYNNLLLNAEEFTFKINMDVYIPSGKINWYVKAISNKNTEIFHVICGSESKQVCEEFLMDLSQELDAVKLDSVPE